MAYELTAAETVADAIRRCAREQLDRAIRALTSELAADPVSAIHTARKAIKKERSLLRLARGALRGNQRAAENAVLREAAARLSGLRDAEVMLQTLASLSERYGARLPEDATAAARERLERDREVERAREAAVQETVEDLRGVRRRVQDWHLSVDGWAALAAGLERSYRDARRAMRRARRDPSLENLHDWRKRVKDTWYELRLLAPVCGPIVGGAAQEAASLSEVLGEEHDLGVLRDRLVELEALTALIDERRAYLQAQAQLIGRRLYAERPNAFVRRLKRLWQAGRVQACASDGGAGGHAIATGGASPGSSASVSR